MAEKHDTPWALDGNEKSWSLLDAAGRRIALIDKGGKDAATRARLIAQAPAMLRELERMVEHFSVFASDHSMDASTETWAALHCAKDVIRDATGHETTHSAPSPSDVFAAWLNEGPKLAAAAGCYVGIKVSAATGEAP